MKDKREKIIELVDITREFEDGVVAAGGIQGNQQGHQGEAEQKPQAIVGTLRKLVQKKQLRNAQRRCKDILVYSQIADGKRQHYRFPPRKDVSCSINAFFLGRLMGRSSPLTLTVNPSAA